MQEAGVQTQLVDLFTREMALSTPLQLHVLRALVSSLQFKCGIATFIGETHFPADPSAAHLPPPAPPLQRVLTVLLGAPLGSCYTSYAAALPGAHCSQRVRPLLRSIIARLNFYQLCSGFSRIVCTYGLRPL